MEDVLRAVGLEEGQVVADRYRIEKVLGIGGMGAVVSARHLHLDERVAIKLLLPDLLDNQEAVERFSREARAAVKIKSEHVAKVTDVGTLANGIPFLVMELLEGGDLAAWVQQKGPLAIDRAAEFVLQACEALAEAHSLGITHRDLKPANLFVVRRADGLDSVKVLDFGISKSAASGMAMTSTAAVMGSPYYMSPEQMESSRGVDHRTDIWSLGVVLYELLTGKIPYGGTSLPEVCLKIVTQPPRPIRELRPDVPVGLENVILRCLEKDREKRFRNVGELAQALAPFAPARARASVDRITRVVHTSALSSDVAIASAESISLPGDGSTQGAWSQPNLHPKGGRRRLFAIAVAALAIALVVGLVMTFRSVPTQTSTTQERASARGPTETIEPPSAPTEPPVAPTEPPSVPAPVAADPVIDDADRGFVLPPSPAVAAAPARTSATAKDSRTPGPAAGPARPAARPKPGPLPSPRPAAPVSPPTGNVFDNRKW